MGQCVEKMRCPDCKGHTLQVYFNTEEELGVEWFTSFCHGSCYEQKGDPYADKKAPTVIKKTEKELESEAKEVLSCKRFLPRADFRGIPPSQFKRWNIRLLLSEYDGKTPYAIAFSYALYGKLIGWKARVLKRKTFFSIGNTRGADPFGLSKAMLTFTDTLWVTEGEFDAIALEYCMIEYGDKPAYPVVSLTMGGGSLEQNLEIIYDRVFDKCKNLVLVLDSDRVGLASVERAKLLWGDKVKAVTCTEGFKDPNDMVKAGLHLEMGKLALEY